MPTNPTTKGERWRFSVAYGGIVEMEAPSYAQLFDGFGETSERERRGRLAAAAPEMFEAWEEFFASYGDPERHARALHMARAALSKAKGEQSK